MKRGIDLAGELGATAVAPVAAENRLVPDFSLREQGNYTVVVNLAREEHRHFECRGLAAYEQYLKRYIVGATKRAPEFAVLVSARIVDEDHDLLLVCTYERPTIRELAALMARSGANWYVNPRGYIKFETADGWKQSYQPVFFGGGGAKGFVK